MLLPILILLLLSVTSPASAHANLARSEPPANSALAAAPAEIRLYFTEPLEGDFSSIRLRDASGAVLEIPPAQIDPTDAYQLVLTPGDLPDGVYTVVWRVLSAADGHITQGSFPLTIGAVTAATSSATVTQVGFRVQDAAVRWLNLISIALVVGGLSFVLFVWQPAVPGGDPVVERQIKRVTWAGWFALVLTTVLILWMQVGIITEAPLWQAALDFTTMRGLISTRFGEISLIRVVMLVVLAAALWVAPRHKAAYWLGLVASGGVMLTQSLFSHASGMQDAVAAVTADWLHLAASSIWIGGLVLFIVLIGTVRRQFSPATPVVSRMVGYFSNYLRAAVALLAVTGVYSAWLHVGSLEALFTTTYGQALVIKSVLIAPLLLIALVNLVLTQRRLDSGQAVWVGYLRQLIGAEIALTVGILAAVGVMTSIIPARGVLAQRVADEAAASTAAVSAYNAYYEAYDKDNIHVDLEISPGYVGENTFNVYMYDHEGNALEDATLVRLRFDHRTEDLGTSELRAEHVGEGRYTIDGANISLPGQWRIRATVQRPGQFDMVIDYSPEVETTPPPPAPPMVDNTLRIDQRALALQLLGIACLGLGGAFIGGQKRHLGALVFTVMLFVSGVFFLFSGAQAGDTSTTVSAAVETGPDFSGNTPVRLAVASGQSLPLLLTADGTLLRPTQASQWQPLPLAAPIQDAYMENNGLIWAATADGLHAYENGEWVTLDATSADRVVMTHGYLFSLGTEGAQRFIGGNLDSAGRVLSLPDTATDAQDLVMLANHTHILHDGGEVFQSADLGLSWTPLDAPAPVAAVSVDPDGDLLAATADGLLRWSRVERTWESLLPLPVAGPITAMQAFNDRLYVTAGGQIYTPASDGWQPLALPAAQGSYITALAERYPSALWALDAGSSRLLTTVDGQTWTVTPIEIAAES